jgi:hypothetical protein
MRRGVWAMVGEIGLEPDVGGMLSCLKKAEFLLFFGFFVADVFVVVTPEPERLTYTSEGQRPGRKRRVI